jgi:predicted ester cyclase
MSVEENVALVRRWFKEVWNEGRVQTIYDLMDPNGTCTGQDLPGIELKGPAAFVGLFNRLHGAFPDIHIQLEDVFGVDDKVTVRWSAVMTHTGDHLGIPATNKKARITGISIARIEKNKIVQGWDNWDQFALMQQLTSTAAAAS